MAKSNDQSQIVVLQETVPSVASNLVLDVDTLIDAVRIPLELKYQDALETAVANAKALRSRAVDSHLIVLTACADNTDDAITAAKERVINNAVNAVSVSVGGDANITDNKIREAITVASEYGRKHRKVELNTQLNLTAPDDDEYSVRISIGASLCVPFSAKQQNAIAEYEAAIREADAADAGVVSLRKEMSQVIDRHVRLVKMKYAKAAVAGNPTFATLSNMIYDGDYAAAITGMTKELAKFGGVADALNNASRQITAD